jgi:ABC-type transport system involved in multi-copper enzyme maturation permease subunit
VSRLLMVELLRFRSRRAMKVVCAGALALIVVIMIVQFFTHSKDDGRAVERFRASRAAQYEQQLAGWNQQFEEMAKDPNFPPEEIERMKSVGVPTREEYMAGEEFGCEGCLATPEDDVYYAAKDLKSMVKSMAGMFAFVAFLLGATAAGAEWNHGTMQSLLFWESRRVRVIVAKVVAVAVSMTAVAVVGELLLHGLGYLVGQARGSTAGMTSGWWQSQAITMGRGLGLVAFAGALGFALAFATRNTGFAFGVAFLYFAVIQNILVAWKPWLVRYVLLGPIAAWLDNGFQHRYWENTTGPNGGVERVINLSMRFGGLALLAYGLIAVALAAAWFRARDVT